MQRQTVLTSVSAGRDGFCRGCGYSLAGLDRARCPECGREFDPRDSRTFSRRGRRKVVWGWRFPGLLVLLMICGGGGFWWLRSEWQREQDEVHRIGGPGYGVNVEFAPIGPAMLHRTLGARYGHLCDRLIDLNLDMFRDDRLAEVNFQAFGFLKRLSVTHFRMRQDSELDHLGKATQVEELTFRYGNLRGLSLAFLARMPALRRLNIYCELDIDQYRQICALKELKALSIGEYNRGRSGLEYLHGLPALEELELRFDEVTDSELKPLKELKSLRVLDIGWMKLTPAQLAKLQEAMPGVLIRRRSG